MTGQIMTQAGPDELRRAAEMIRKHGHCKHTLRDMQGQLCLVGALCVVDDYRHERWLNLKAALEAVLAEQFPDRMGLVYKSPFEDSMREIVGFNNHKDTTPDEVIAVMEKAAARMEEEML